MSSTCGFWAVRWKRPVLDSGAWTHCCLCPHASICLWRHGRGSGGNTVQENKVLLSEVKVGGRQRLIKTRTWLWVFFYPLLTCVFKSYERVCALIFRHHKMYINQYPLFSFAPPSMAYLLSPDCSVWLCQDSCCHPLMLAVQFRTSILCCRLQKGLIKPVVWSERKTHLNLPQADCCVWSSSLGIQTSRARTMKRGLQP